MIHVYAEIFVKIVYYFIDQGCIKMIKSVSKGIWNVIFQINEVILSVLFICES